MEAAPKILVAPMHASVADAKHAYFEGDFERCLELCANIRVCTLATASEVALMVARAYLRTGRLREAYVTIVDSRATHTTLDAWLTAQMLEATALIRQGDPDSGLALLVDAARLAVTAHIAIRSEIAFSTALAYWAKRDIDRAESFLALVDPRSDIIHARALELQAWCHTARRDYRRAADFFRLTLLRLDTCQAGDRAINATAISTLAIYAAELFDRDIAQFVEARAQDMSWSSGLSAQRYITLEHQALFHEFAGNTLTAFAYALQAHENASSGSDDVFGWALRSALARNAGEKFTAIIFAQRARESLRGLNACELNGEERFAMLGVAEQCVYFDPDTTVELFSQYGKLTPIDAIVSSAGDPRLAAFETYVSGIVAQAQSNIERAKSCFRQAYEAFKDLGYVRRAVVAANAFLDLADDDDMRSYIAVRLAGITNFIIKGLAPRLDPAVSLVRHPLLASLPRTQREVVLLICMGKTNKEIAAFRHVHEQTIKNLLSKSVFPAFGVSSRTALVSTCLQHS